MRLAEVMRTLQRKKAEGLRNRAEDAKRRAANCTSETERLVQLRRMRDFQKLADESEH